MAKHDVEAFHLPEEYDPVPGLLDEVHRLHREGRHRSALDTVLQVLRRDGKSAHAFWCAQTLCSGRTRGADSSLAEPITDRQLRSPYLAPIATECAKCMNHWYSAHALFARSEISVSNPIGLQCQSCRYTLCRNCLKWDDLRCPEPGCRGSLTTPVLATGRPRGQQANTHTEKLEHVLILWQGRTPTADEIGDLVDLACTWQDSQGIRITSHKVPRSTNLDQALAAAIVPGMEDGGELSPGALSRTRFVPVESRGLGRRLLLIIAAPSGQPAAPPSAHTAPLVRGEIATADSGTPRLSLFRRWLRRP